MKACRRTALIAMVLTVLALAAAGRAAASTVWELSVEGPIGPVTSAYVDEEITAADEAGVEAVILRLDTPGGLDQAMRGIVQRILAARTPVVAWVAPAGARAASAGTYILYASHVAAMAPATNLGAATPVRLGGGGATPSGDEGGSGDGDALHRKMVNDAVAYIRGLAELRGRNGDWAEKAVREGASLEAGAAREAGVVELLAGNRDELLATLDGRRVETAAGERTLHTRGATVVDRSPDWRTRLLAAIAHPNFAYILMLIGIYGLIFELANPGAVVPGVIGGIALLLALYALQVLSVSYAGLGLILLGVGLMLAEAFAPSFGILGLGGAVAFVAGSLMLFDTEAPGFRLSLALVVGVALGSAILLFATGTLAARAYRRPVVSGQQQLVGARGRVVSGFPGAGHVRVFGELWRADCDTPMAAGAPVRVVAVDGLRLHVEPADSTAESADSEDL
ncbi:nodulation protein NfeD [Arhodomonas sp. KWT2]|uniref:NfeD family protein n=1 Tax=unclassified Arhodomonas TaxID=2621637 RepID=UPI001F09B6AD|nr:nodulation protein NfeD [Arhodomonas sp. KWT]